MWPDRRPVYLECQPPLWDRVAVRAGCWVWAGMLALAAAVVLMSVAFLR